MSRRMIFGITMFVVIAIIAVFLVSITINRGGKSASGRKPVTTTAQVKQSVGAIVANPIVYDGQNVQFDGNLSDWATKRVYTVSDTQTSILGNSGASIIIIADHDYKLTTDPTSTAVGLGDTGKVFVKGRVTIMDRNQLSAAIGYDLDGPEIALDNNGLVKGWNKGTVIILQSITKE